LSHNTESVAAKPASPTGEALRVFFQNKAAIFGLVMLTVVLVMTFFGPYLYGVDPFKMVHSPFTPPGEAPGLWLGTDYLGRDLTAGVINGGRATLAVGGAAAIITVLIGVTLGALAGFYGGLVDEILMRITEFFQVLPALLFAMVLVALFSPSLVTITISIGVVAWPQTARLTRAEFLKIKELEYVTAARAISSKNARIIWCVILPNALPPLIVSATLVIGVAILFEAGLSFLGLGDPNVMSWGLMIGSNREHILDAWWAVVFPGAAIFVTVLSVSLIGDGLNDAFNPRLRER
jgi:peptide/nickel transport system permease protein